MKFLFIGLFKKLIWKVGICASFTIKFLLNVFGLGPNNDCKKTDDLNQDFSRDFKNVFEVSETKEKQEKTQQITIVETPENPEQTEQTQESLKQPLSDDYDVVSIEEIERIDQLV